MLRVHCATLEIRPRPRAPPRHTTHHPQQRGQAGGGQTTRETRQTPTSNTTPQRYGGHSEGETPGPIPNPEAKPFSANGTAPARVWESRTPPNTHPRKGEKPTGFSPFLRSGSVRRAPIFRVSDRHRSGPTRPWSIGPRSVYVCTSPAIHWRWSTRTPSGNARLARRVFDNRQAR